MRRRLWWEVLVEDAGLIMVCVTGIGLICGWWTP